MNGSWTYTYDDFARLKSASGSQDFVYGYDQYANRWSTMTGTQQYSFSGVNNHITTNGFAYDAAGNMTNDSIHSYTYDAEGRLKAVDSGNTAKYNYDAFGNRTMQFSTNPSVYNEYVVDLSGRAITAIQPGTSNVYTAEVFAGGRHWVTDNGGALFLGTDWLGTTRALTELNGTFAQLYTSLPWGDGLSSGGSSFHTTSQYTGKEYDPESGLYHFPARQYAPVQGRWLTPDPAGISAMRLDSPQSWNRYAYVLNNPLSNVDPTGLYPGGDCDTADPGCSGNGGAPGDGDSADCPAEFSNCSGYYLDGVQISSSTAAFLVGSGAGVLAGMLPSGPGWGLPGPGDYELLSAGCQTNRISDQIWCPGIGVSMNNYPAATCQAPFLCDTTAPGSTATISARHAPTHAEINAACSVVAIDSTSGLGINPGDSSTASNANGVVFQQYTQYERPSTINPSAPNVTVLSPLVAPGWFIQDNYHKCLAAFGNP